MREDTRSLGAGMINTALQRSKLRDLVAVATTGHGDKIKGPEHKLLMQCSFPGRVPHHKFGRRAYEHEHISHVPPSVPDLKGYRVQANGVSDEWIWSCMCCSYIGRNNCHLQMISGDGANVWECLMSGGCP